MRLPWSTLPLHKCPIGPGRREGAHVLGVARGEALHVRVGVPQVGGRAVEQLGAPGAESPVPHEAGHVHYNKMAEKYPALVH